MAFDPASILTALAAPPQTRLSLGAPKATSPAGGVADTAFAPTVVLTALAGSAPAPGGSTPAAGGPAPGGDFDAHGILTALAASGGSPRGGMPAADIRQLIVEEAQRHGIEPALALALARQESGFRPDAVSPTGVVGLYQVTVPTGLRYGQTAQTRTDPRVSARAGLAYLVDLLRQTGDVRQALSRYGDPRETDFPDKVLRHVPQMQTVLAQARSPQQLVRPSRAS